jgi:serine phosphatase RsbU (regulator of sigma subunit)
LRTVPARARLAGGDFYDAFELAGGRVGLILGDVSGHGQDALARTTFVRYTLRAYLEAGLEPRGVLKVAAEALAGRLDDGFATVTVAIHDPLHGRLTYASAGHPPPVVAGNDTPFDPVIACSAPPLGIGEPTGFRQSTIALAAGARACLYTDGTPRRARTAGYSAPTGSSRPSPTCRQMRTRMRSLTRSTRWQTRSPTTWPSASSQRRPTHQPPARASRSSRS